MKKILYRVKKKVKKEQKIQKKQQAKHKKVKKEEGHRCGKRVLYFNDSFQSVGSMEKVPLIKKKFGYEILRSANRRSNERDRQIDRQIDRKK